MRLRAEFARLILSSTVIGGYILGAAWMPLSSFNSPAWAQNDKIDWSDQTRYPAFKKVYGNSDKNSQKYLFIGNSIIFCHEMPRILAAMIKEKKPDLKVEVEMVAGPSYSLQGHIDEGLATSELKRQHWDKVVLQELTAMPEHDRKCTEKALSTLDKLARKQGARVYLMETYSDHNKPTGATQKILRESAVKFKEELIPCGEVFHYVRDNYSRIGIYSFDRHHPSFAGSYLLALVVYSTFFHESPRGVSNILTDSKQEKPIVTIPGAQNARQLQDSTWFIMRNYK